MLFGRAAKWLGFKFEGLFCQALVYKSRNRDTAWFSIIDSEWPVLEKVFNVWLSEDNFDEFGHQVRKLEEFKRFSGLLAKFPDK